MTGELARKDGVFWCEIRGIKVDVSHRYNLTLYTDTGYDLWRFRSMSRQTCLPAAFFVVRLIHYTGMYADVWEPFEWPNKWERFIDVITWHIDGRATKLSSMWEMSHYIHEGSDG